MKKTVLITGASTGIGRASVAHFQQQGWNVIATMRTPENEEELGNLENVLVTKLDVTDLDSINNAIQKGIETFGKIDVLVNNAGYGAYGPLEAIPRENVIRQFDTNVIGLLDVCRAIIPHFRQNKEGILINVSSVGGKMGLPFGSLYHGSKFAVEGITEALHFELEQIGCKTKLIEPGTIVTDFATRSFDFQNDESIIEYQSLVQSLFNALGGILSDENRAAPPSVAAEVIFQAATDGTNKFRYTAGYDAEDFLKVKEQSSDEEYFANVKAAFGL